MRAFPNDSTIQVVRVKYGHPLGRGPEATAIGTLDTEAFNKSKAMELPRNIVIGHDALLAVGEVCQALKLGKKALIVADENTIKIAGKTVEKEVTGREIRHSEDLIPGATWEEVRDGEERIRKGDFEFAIGVGGGRSIDVAKCASFNAGVPFVSVPTAASHDGVVSSRASIQKDGEKVSLAAQTPIAVIMDTGVIAESPFRLLASGCEHNISHALDRIAKKPGLHGEQCGVGTIMMMYLHAGNWQEVRDALLTIGAPTTARALGVTDDEVVQALVHAHEVNKERYTILGDEGLTLEAAERLAKITKVV